MSDLEGRHCRACLSTRVRLHRASRVTGFQVLGCRQCGAHMLADPPADDDLIADGDIDATEFGDWTDRLREVSVRADHDAVIARLAELTGLDPHAPEPASLFDLGAGDGAFLAQARDAGFRPAGNEIAAGAVDLAAQRHGIDLLHGDLGQMDDPPQHDALTMWCVLAHVEDGDTMLRNATKAVRPGGVLFVLTPAWSLFDRVALALFDLTGGRVSRIVDRRVAQHHMLHHTTTSLAITLRRAGLDPVDVTARPRYALTTVDYLASLGVRGRVGRSIGRVLDRLIERGWFFKNVLEAYSRKPAAGRPGAPREVGGR